MKKADILAQGCRGPVARRRIVYLATPLDQFRHPDYRQVCRSLDAYFQKSESAIFEPAQMLWTTSEWLKAWLRLSRWIDALVVWPRVDMSVSFGVCTEVWHIQRLAKPIYIVHDGELRVFADFHIYLRQCSPVHYARARAGRIIRPGKVPKGGG